MVGRPGGSGDVPPQERRQVEAVLVCSDSRFCLRASSRLRYLPRANYSSVHVLI